MEDWSQRKSISYSNLGAGFFMEISHAVFPSALAGDAALQQLMVVLHLMCRFDVLVTPDDTSTFTISLNR